ncbi:MAG: hypothetical protein J6N53_17995 [Lachnospiraceae bacterium]|nr:hypothetical protein [Lachnospiraceae bacterium]
MEDLDSQECMYRLNKRYFGKEVFVKTIKKGFSLICSLEELISKGNIKKMCAQHSIDVKDKMIISERIKICEDSLGKREVRFFVEDAQIKNASRYILDGLPHHVAGKFYDKAKEVTERICEGFPGNYVLDLGEYEVDGHKQVDVIEFNPISVSSVYVNNSIFSEKTAQIKACYDEYGFGYEWCLLAMKDKDFIIKERNGMHKYCVDNVLYGI